MKIIAAILMLLSSCATGDDLPEVRPVVVELVSINLETRYNSSGAVKLLKQTWSDRQGLEVVEYKGNPNSSDSVIGQSKIMYIIK